MHRKCRLLSLGKASSHSTALPSFPPPVCSVFVFPFHRLWSLLFSIFITDGYGIFNVRTSLGAYRTHEGGSDTKKSAQGMIRRDRKTIPHPVPPPEDRNPGSSNLNSDALTTDPRPSVRLYCLILYFSNETGKVISCTGYRIQDTLLSHSWEI